MKTISEFMTPCPYVIDAAQTIDDALHQMEIHQVRHLPVAKAGELIGVLSKREVMTAHHLCSAMHFPAHCGDVCDKDPLIVSSNSMISPVALEMAERSLEYVLIADENDSVVGIFTTTDACRYIHYLTSTK